MIIWGEQVKVQMEIMVEVDDGTTQERGRLGRAAVFGVPDELFVDSTCIAFFFFLLHPVPLLCTFPVSLCDEYTMRELCH